MQLFRIFMLTEVVAKKKKKEKKEKKRKIIGFWYDKRTGELRVIK
jgi:hypothetical protein